MQKILVKVGQLENLEEIKSRVILALLAGCMIFAVLYSYFLASTIYDGAKIKELSSKMNDLTVKTAALESKYIALVNSVTMDKALAMGYREVAEPTYISRTALGQAVSFNNEI